MYLGCMTSQTQGSKVILLNASEQERAEMLICLAVMDV